MADDVQDGGLQHPLRLWSGWVIGPAAWALHLLGSYLLVPKACEAETVWLLHAVTLVTLMLGLAGVVVAWRQWTRAGRRWPGSGDDGTSNIRFMAVMGLLISALSSLLIVAEGVPSFFLSPCL
ncbi:hypothetical protein [Halomonas korlensis]|uniref:Transmembrane protein n=1 Tax=Halomonas korlensis TaxID=463301 RepID=A0A1I7JGC4_9GAMM|nr:hypothetical protein [Halomonas korlensis]SFU84194.1 hypothetical protein SAMN04487955_110117 [Halomonas korlensis]